MFDRSRFTTKDTGRPVAWWHQPKGAPQLYWRDDEWQRMEARNHPDRRGIRKLDLSGYKGPKKRKKKANPKTPARVFATCEVCGTRYQVQTKNAKTCSPYCSGVLYKRTQAARDRGTAATDEQGRKPA